MIAIHVIGCWGVCGWAFLGDCYSCNWVLWVCGWVFLGDWVYCG
jgi:hypothetical protein